MTDRAGSDGGFTPPEWIAPDDARELEVDLRALRRERAAAARQARLQAALGRRRWRCGTPGLVVLLALLGVLAVGGGLLVLAPVGMPTRSAARPLATAAAPPGSAGGLLPEVTLRVGSEDRPARTLRPAVLALPSLPCGCFAALGDVAAEAGQYGLPVVLVTAAENRELTALLRAARMTRAYSAVDAGSVLATAYGARGLTVLLVRSDGVVTAVEREVSGGGRLGTLLSDLDG